MAEMKSSVVPVSVAAEVAVVVAVVSVVDTVAGEVMVAEVGRAPAVPAERGNPELLKLRRGAFFGEAVYKEAVSLSR